MGNNKSESIKWLSIHVLVYSFVLLIGLVPLLIDFKFLIIKWVIINGILHWITDFFSSKVAKFFYLKNNLYYFWLIIGLDQLIHAITLILTFNLFIL